MTIPVCDYDAILAGEPTTWRDRGLHWHCFSWRGDGQAMQSNETGRADPGSELPPVAIRDWLRKPQHLMRGAQLTPDDAAGWLRAEYEQIRPQISGDIGDGLPADRLTEMHLHDLRCGNDPVIVRWLRGGSMAHLAVLAVSAGECDRHQS